MRVRLGLVVCTLVLVALPAIASGEVRNSCRISRLPKEAQVLLNREYANWRPKDVSDLGADDRQYWSKAHTRGCPGIAAGHFEGPYQLSYALLLVPKSESTQGYRIVVLTKVTDDSYTLRVLDLGDSGASDSGMVIFTAPQGSYSDSEGTTSVQLKLDGIYVEWIEKGAAIYYWKDGNYLTLQTSE